MVHLSCIGGGCEKYLSVAEKGDITAWVEFCGVAKAKLFIDTLAWIEWDAAGVAIIFIAVAGIALEILPPEYKKVLKRPISDGVRYRRGSHHGTRFFP
ncbi:MAG: hypothetical protein LBJ43_01055 [Propionibacteriaceae bacterium]|nr:hypothetical protein [Propionibacteriaceae bacterium]